MQKLIRYSKAGIYEKRELVLLRCTGCKWKRCVFCDYHIDSCQDEEENFKLNKTYLDKVTGEYGVLDVANSGSFFELNKKTIDYIKKICIEKKIKKLICEAHWIYREKIKDLKKYFAKSDIDVKVKLGLETFDYEFREFFLKKGIDEKDPKKLAFYFDRICLLFGLHGQTLDSMKNDVNLGLKYFEHIYINIMTKNSTPILPDESVKKIFREKIFPEIKHNKKIEVLWNHTDLNIGGIIFE